VNNMIKVKDLELQQSTKRTDT